jgi:uncharacterized protein (DUF983 family)
LCYAGGAFGFYEVDNEVAQSGNVLGAISSPDTAAIFVVVLINHVVASVFNASMFAIGLNSTLSDYAQARHARREAGIQCHGR